MPCILHRFWQSLATWLWIWATVRGSAMIGSNSSNPMQFSNIYRFFEQWCHFLCCPRVQWQVQEFRRQLALWKELRGILLIDISCSCIFFRCVVSVSSLVTAWVQDRVTVVPLGLVLSVPGLFCRDQLQLSMCNFLCIQLSTWFSEKLKEHDLSLQHFAWQWSQKLRSVSMKRPAASISKRPAASQPSLKRPACAKRRLAWAGGWLIRD